MRAHLVAAVLLSACRPLTFVGSADDGAVDVRDAPRDRDDDGGDGGDVPDAGDDAADVPDVSATEERLGIGGRGIALAADGVADDRAIRVVYVGDDGVLRVERRDSDSLARLCEQTFPPPAGYVFASAPAVHPISPLVLIATREAASGRIRHHALTPSTTPTSCGAGFFPWAALPDAPAGQALVSAPGVVALPLGEETRAVAVSLTDDGALLSTEASLSNEAAIWSPWTRWPSLPDGERVVASPTAQVHSAVTILVLLTVEAPGGRRRVIERPFELTGRRWGPAWTSIETAVRGPDSPLSVLVFTIDPRVRQGPHPYGTWRLYRDAAGDYWGQVAAERRGELLGYSAWANHGNPFNDRGVKPAAPVISPRRNATHPTGELLMLSTPSAGPRVLRYTSTWLDTLEDPPGRWREAPDPLR